MKKLLLMLGILALSGCMAWALPDNVTSNEYTKTQAIKTTGGFVYMVNVTYRSAAAGDTVQIYDGAPGSANSVVRMTCVATAANSSCAVPLTVGAVFSNSIFLQVNSNTGNVYTDIQYF